MRRALDILMSIDNGVLSGTCNDRLAIAASVTHRLVGHLTMMRTIGHVGIRISSAKVEIVRAGVADWPFACAFSQCEDCCTLGDGYEFGNRLCYGSSCRSGYWIDRHFQRRRALTLRLSSGGAAAGRHRGGSCRSGTTRFVGR